MSVCAVITGGGGFLGRTILRQCRERGWTIRALGRKMHAELVGLGSEFIPIDISLKKNIPALAKIFDGADVIFHTAAKAGYWGRRREYERENVAGTENVLAACRTAGTRNLVYTSTPSVVFNGNSIAGGNENLPCCADSLSDYASTKAAAEERVRAAHAPGALRTVSLRPHLLWGAGDPHIIPRIIDRAAQMKLRIVGNGANRVDLTHVENAAHAHMLAAEALLSDAGTLCGAPAGTGRTYFVSDGAPVVLWDWLNALLRGLGIAPVERRVSFKSAYRAGAFLEFFWRIFGVAGEPPLTRFVAVELSHDHWFDISAIRRDLHYAPIVSAERGFSDLLAAFR